MKNSSRIAIRKRDQGRCQYCLSIEMLMGLAFEIDHINLIAKGGTDDLDNLCLACPECNRYKRDRISFIDPETGEEHRFFHPLKDDWDAHFAWRVNGRATIAGLRMNRRLLQIARRHWIRLGEHPPT